MKLTIGLRVARIRKTYFSLRLVDTSTCFEYTSPMSIAEFAKQHRIPIMTIRFYIERGLLNPVKEKGNWVFSQEDSKIMEEILTYKNCGFSLQTIKQMLDLRKESIGDETERAELIRNLLLVERAKLKDEHMSICEAIKMLDLECASRKQTDNIANSIPLRLFALIACPYCDIPLEWEETVVSQNAVRQGVGKCNCGFKAKIDDGVLFCSEKPIIQSVDANLETIRKRTARDISTLEKYFLWLIEHLNTIDLQGKIMFEDVINLICFTSKALPLLRNPPDMILSDSLPSAVLYYAAALHAIYPDCGLLMIVDDGVHHPLKRGCLDIVLDYCSSEIIQSYGYSSAFSLMRSYMKPNATVLGRFSYLYRQKSPIGNTIVPTNYIRYNLQVLKKSMLENCIHITEDLEGDENLEESIYNGCRPGDIIRPYVFIGRAAIDSTSFRPDDSSFHSLP